MNITDFKRIDLILKKVMAEIEDQALDEGVDVASTEYIEIVEEAKRRVFERMGVSQEEYLEYMEENAPLTKKEALSIVESTKELLGLIRELQERRIPSDKEIEEVATRVAKNEVKPPVTITQVVKETIVEQPRVVKELRVEKTIREEKYDDAPLREMFAKLDKAIQEKVIPEPVDLQKFREELREEFQTSLAKSTNIMDMPNFRKLAMGLQTQIEEVRASAGGGTTVEVPPETPLADGSVTEFTASAQPQWIVADGATFFENAGYTYSVGTGKVIPTNPVTQYIRIFI